MENPFRIAEPKLNAMTLQFESVRKVGGGDGSA
jgi:hypothetical protein